MTAFIAWWFMWWLAFILQLRKLRRATIRAAATPRFSSRAYLVVHLNLRQSPPVATFACIYSCSARDLTMTGVPEARADLYMVEADTFEEALREMERIQPLYFPWVTPLLTRNR